MKRAFVCLAFLGACGSEASETRVETGSAIDHGRFLFSDRSTSQSSSNRFTCATCHPGTSTKTIIYSGAALDGATSRASFWGGERVDLLESINDCRLSFMDAVVPWTRDDDDARAMYAFLTTKTGDSKPVPFTLVRAAPDLPAGDAVGGKAIFDDACVGCHGTAHAGVGRLVTFAPILPDEVDSSHAALSPTDRRLVYLRKIREGGFTQIGGNMPPFSRETLSDDAVAGVLAYLRQY